MEIKLKAIIYARVSSDRQTKEGNGLDSQAQRCKEYARSKGYEVEEVFLDSFTGGGDFMKRPAMSALINYVDSKPHNKYIVVFDDLKRFARDVEFHLKLRSAFKSRDITPECLNFNFDDTPEGRYVETILAAGAELERNQNKRQVVQKTKARLERGYWGFSSKVPGFVRKNLSDGTWVLHPNEPIASVIREGLEGFASGRFSNKEELRKFLDENGFYKDKKVYADTASRLLKRASLYAGFIEYPDWEVARREGKHKGIISEDILDKIERKLENKPLYPATQKQGMTKDFPLRGFIVDSVTRHPLTASWTTGRNGKHPYYRFNKKESPYYGKSIPIENIHSDFLDLLTENHPKEQIVNLAEKIIKDVWEKRMVKLFKKGEGSKKEIEKLEEEKKTFLDRIVNAKNESVIGTYEQRIGDIEKEIKQLKKQVKSDNTYPKTFGTALASTMKLIKNPEKLWLSDDLAKKRLAYKLVFSRGPAYDLKTGFGTAELSPIYNVFEAISVSGSCDVDLSNNSFNRLKSYLVDFWHFYENCPRLQKALSTT